MAAVHVALRSNAAIELMQSDDNDETFVERLRQQDEGAFDQFVARERDSVARLVGRLIGWQTDVDDVVQDVFLAAWRNLPRFRGRFGLSAWLRQIAINACRGHERKLRVRLRRFRQAGQNHTALSEDAADRRSIDRETAQQVRRSIARLPPKYREVVVLYYLEQQDLDEIAASLRLRRNTVEVRLHRARLKLKEMLGSAQE